MSSSYDAAALSVLRQSYYPGERVTLATVTQTLQGITTKQLLLGTTSGQLFAMDKRYLDPRRPPAGRKPTPAEVEERLIPYSDVLPFHLLGYVTHDKSVARLRAVTVAPAGLESTCLVFVAGTSFGLFVCVAVVVVVFSCLYCAHTCPLTTNQQQNNTNNQGADLFYGRVTPARHFDALEADFSYGLLIAGLVALAAGTAFVRHLAARSALKAKWQ